MLHQVLETLHEKIGCITFDSRLDGGKLCMPAFALKSRKEQDLRYVFVLTERVLALRSLACTKRREAYRFEALFELLPPSQSDHP